MSGLVSPRAARASPKAVRVDVHGAGLRSAGGRQRRGRAAGAARAAPGRAAPPRPGCHGCRRARGSPPPGRGPACRARLPCPRRPRRRGPSSVRARITDGAPGWADATLSARSISSRSCPSISWVCQPNAGTWPRTRRCPSRAWWGRAGRAGSRRRSPSGCRARRQLACSAASQFDPSASSRSPQSTHTRYGSLSRRLPAMAMPTPIGRPWPSEPVATSTHGSRGVGALPGGCGPAGS